ncbi:serine/threonine protein phosphatase 1 [Pedobacter sp. AK013]|uniref:metallophosphoesterase family protein n=1 Tax=Pedobacter sp. AK013 TaxID=2723071 RepID=UPI00160D1A57|nr:metallophosphoesterase family protein [Pedobacter sp. AK013]MBB6239959.1 serine/threonine protein phosphatase 1 [Pedobacter sp. AK013]
MRTFVVSDIHGNDDAFRKALKTVHLKKTDRLILLGDYIDRGFDSKAVLDTIFLLREYGFDLICLKGNHEQMLLDALEDPDKLNNWLMNGGNETLSSFLTSSIHKIPAKYIDLLESFRLYYEYEQYIFVHAALNMRIADPFSDVQTILWSRSQNELLDYGWLGERILIHGHTPTMEQEIINNFEDSYPIKCIDNGVFVKKHGYGGLCILELENFSLNFVHGYQKR